MIGKLSRGRVIISRMSFTAVWCLPLVSPPILYGCDWVGQERMDGIVIVDQCWNKSNRERAQTARGVGLLRTKFPLLKDCGESRRGRAGCITWGSFTFRKLFREFTRFWVQVIPKRSWIYQQTRECTPPPRPNSPLSETHLISLD